MKDDWAAAHRSWLKDGIDPWQCDSSSFMRHLDPMYWHKANEAADSYKFKEAAAKEVDSQLKMEREYRLCARWKLNNPSVWAFDLRMEDVFETTMGQNIVDETGKYWL